MRSMLTSAANRARVMSFNNAVNAFSSIFDSLLILDNALAIELPKSPKTILFGSVHERMVGVTDTNVLSRLWRVRKETQNV